jgi:hypothetical protein
VCVEVKVVSVDPDKKQTTTRTGALLTRQNFTIADKTAAMVLTAWEKFIDTLEVGKCYEISCLTVRSYSDIKYLNSNLDTTLKEIDEIPDVCEDEVKEKIYPRMLAKVSEIVVHRYRSCGACKKTIPPEETDESTTRCSFCNMKQRTDALPLNTYAKMRLVAEDKSAKQVTCFATTLNVFFASSDDGPNDVEEMTTDEVEDFFLEQDYLLYTINEIDNLVIHIAVNPI